MRFLIVFLCLFFVVFSTFAQLIKLPFRKEDYGFFHARNINFSENKGQWNDKVQFRANLHEANVWFEKDRFVFVLLQPKQLNEFFSFKTLSFEERKSRKVQVPYIDAHAYNKIFVGANPSVIVKGLDALPHYENYFIGNDPNYWASEVGVFQKIQYKELYAGIDLVVYESAGRLKYDFIVTPGADPSVIVTKFEGCGKISVKNGKLLIPTSVNNMYQLKPFTYQMINDRVVEVPSKFKVRNNRVSFYFPEGYNPEYELIIDPAWVFGSYTGSTADNWGYTATYDADGNLYAGGSVFNVGYPITTGAFQVNFAGGSCDISISKFNPTGTTLIYSTYLGASGAEVPHSLIVNNLNQLYVYGTTGSLNFPMAGASFDSTFNSGQPYSLTNIIDYSIGSDIFIARLSSNGQQLISSTFVGGSGNDGLNMFIPLRNNYADDCRGEIIIDKNDNIYVVSTTSSTDFPVTTGAFQTTYAGGALDGIVFKMNDALSTMIWSSYLGGSGIDAVYSIALDKFDNPVVAGGTTSTNFPTSSNAINPTFMGGTCDGFVTRISSNGNAILRSTYWGTPQYDQVYFVDLDKSNNVYMLGQTRDPNSTLRLNATWWQPGGGQFISKLDPSLSTIEWSTIFGTGGGNIDISPTAFMVDYCNSIYLSGWGSLFLNGFGGTSGLPITANAFQSTTDGNDYYFMAIADDASSLLFGSFYGGSFSREHVDGGTSRFDETGKIYQSVCAGCGGWDDFPTTSSAWSNVNNSINCNKGVIKIDFELPVIIAEFTDNAPVCLPTTVQFTNTSHTPNPGITSCFWDFGDGNTSTNCNPIHAFDSAGLYTVMLVMSDLNSCNLSDTIYHQVLVLSNSTDTIPDAHMCQGSFVQIGIPPYVGQGISYQWSPSTYLNNTSIANPISNSPSSIIYTLLVSHGVCTDTLTQRVNVYNIQVDAGTDTLICRFNHTLQATSTGGGSDTQYHWSSNNQFTNWLNSSPNNSYANITLTGPGWYYVMAFNQWCSDIDSVYVDFLDANIVHNFVSPLCFGDCNGSITAIINAGTPPFSYIWSNGDTTQTISNLCAGLYTVTISDADACEFAYQMELEQPEEMLISYFANHIPCEEACIGRIDIDVLGGTPPYTYFWNTGQTSNPITGLCEGTYQLTVTDSHNCQKVSQSEVLINYIYQNVQVWADDDTLWENQSTFLHATQIPDVNYTWSPSTWLSQPFENSTNVSPPPGEHWYYVVLDNGFGCIYTDSLKIVVLDVFCEEPFIYLPNAFTPDGDGQNDVLYVRGIYIEELEFLIFDRWGNLIFETRDKNVGWDGTFKGRKLDPAVYAFYLKIICYNKVIYTKEGNITLIR